MHSPTAVRMMVEPIDRPANAASPIWPTMAVSIRMKVGSAMSWPKVGRASAMIRRLVERASVGPLLTFVFAPACGVPKPSRRVVSPELVALASEESMGTLTRISRLTALRKYLLWARNVIPRLSTKLSPVCG